MKSKKYLEKLLSNEFVIEEYKIAINKYVDGLEQQVKNLKKAIDKIIKIINYYGIDKEYNDNTVLRNVLKNMLDILKEA